MPKVPWPIFIAAHPTSYLVAAVAPKAQRRPLRQRLGMLVALLGQLKLAKAYAVTIDRQSAAEIHIAFEDEAEARRFAEVVEAQPAASRDPAWAAGSNSRFALHTPPTQQGTARRPHTSAASFRSWLDVLQLPSWERRLGRPKPGESWSQAPNPFEEQIDQPSWLQLLLIERLSHRVLEQHCYTSTNQA